MVHAGQEFLRENYYQIVIKIDGSLPVALRVTDKVGSPWKVELLNENYTISIDFGNYLHYKKLMCQHLLFQFLQLKLEKIFYPVLSFRDSNKSSKSRKIRFLPISTVTMSQQSAYIELIVRISR